FGNNGGEEFLSFMNISEALAATGGTEWKNWDRAMNTLVGKAQNGDGSWAGHHCITGRTFCTAAALLTLMADRTPLPGVLITHRTETPKPVTPTPSQGEEVPIKAQIAWPFPLSAPGQGPGGRNLTIRTEEQLIGASLVKFKIGDTAGRAE